MISKFYMFTYQVSKKASPGQIKNDKSFNRRYSQGIEINVHGKSDRPKGLYTCWDDQT